jgi:hypothetical protein
VSREPNSKEHVARRILIGEDRQRLLQALERDLIAAVDGPTIDLSMGEVRKEGLLAVLRKLAVKKPIKPSFDS